MNKEEFFKYRIETVRDQVSLYDLLIDLGIKPRSKDSASQLKCCFTTYHAKGNDLKPSARYFPKKSDAYENYYCWVCTKHPLDVISFYQRVKDITFTQSLYALEHQNNITYHDVEIEKDFQLELDQLQKLKTVDLKAQFRFCENLLRENRKLFDLKTFVKMSYILDKLYVPIEDKETLKKLSLWSNKIQGILR